MHTTWDLSVAALAAKAPAAAELLSLCSLLAPECLLQRDNSLQARAHAPAARAALHGGRSRLAAACRRGSSARRCCSGWGCTSRSSARAA